MVIHLKIDLLSWLLFPQAGADQRWNQGGGANHKSRPGVIWASGCVHLIVLGGGHLYQVLQEVDRFTRFSEQAVVRCTSQDLHTSGHVTQVLLCNMASEEVSLSWQRLMNRWEVFLHDLVHPQVSPYFISLLYKFEVKQPRFVNNSMKRRFLFCFQKLNWGRICRWSFRQRMGFVRKQ